MGDSKVSAEVKVSINKGKPLEQISFPNEKLLLYDNKEQLVTVKTTPKSAEYKDISFVTNNSNVLSLHKLYKGYSTFKINKAG